MGFFGSMNVSATGLSAQRFRMDVISQNIANVDTTRTEDGTPYKRKLTLFEERKDNNSFSNFFTNALSLSGAEYGNGVRVSRVVEDQSEGTKVYEPSHPDADEDGYVLKPNVNIVNEMVNMIAASRSYEANLTAMNATKSMITKTLEIGK